MQVEAGFGDTHNDLRFAVSLLSGIEMHVNLMNRSGANPGDQAASSTAIRKGRPCLISMNSTTPSPSSSK